MGRASLYRVPGFGAVFWDLTYILTTRCSLQTRSYAMPILGLMINVSWELVYGFYVAETALERSGFVLWLILDLGLVHLAWILGVLLLVGCWGHFAFASWWLSVPGIAFVDKAGKWWRGMEGYDQTELAYWSAGVAMLLVRQHSGGTNYRIIEFGK
ncbi:hypothetical protein BKA67DRAFT_594299 [Truncatella angustata]|uniref:Uncharacterized protein n=1 Tax=Truncatella angustata TaxID=152316 RepID=A0A9P8UFD5_9PEZI|nr:uncharacterized protein BKA67DRAFT_594299 [Truncatella angustata]KAH6648961.1 hypothetical protein BKA67DRAFT_594299 [Truncatella angustata]